ncbi:MAG: DUF58 domain-containing protein [Anaerolineae bacterium]|nr:DUF58 domain-containing protein [Anaerolineae bacterium]
MPAERLFDEKTLRKLEQLRLIAHKVRSGAVKGERRSIKKGTSIEFADYRDYTRGDDLRRLDWNVYARLEKPFIKLLEEEEDLTVHILLDTSESMNWPPNGLGGVGGAISTVDVHKFRYGMRLAAALAHIALTTGDRVSVSLLTGARMADRWGPVRGRGQTLSMLTWLEHLRTGGTTDLNAALADYAVRGGRAGLVLLIGDMLSPGGYRDGLNALQGRGHEVAVLHLLSPDEIEPVAAGDIRLIDSETGAGQDVTIDGAMRGLYARRLREWRSEMASYCLGRGAHYVAMETSTPWENVILYALRRAGVVR